MSENPVVVLVHGAFAESASWNGVVERLRARSIETVAVANPLRSLEGDAQYVRDVIAGIGKPVVLVGHSYGGMVITQAASDNDAVQALVYVCAFAPDHGETAFQLSLMFPGSTLGDALNAYPVSTGGNELAIRPDVFRQQFCADVPAEQGALMAATQRPVTQAALTEPSRYAAWKSLPSYVIYGSDDRNIPAAVMRFMAERAHSRKTVSVEHGSHALMVSHPAEVAALIEDAASAN